MNFILTKFSQMLSAIAPPNPDLRAAIAISLGAVPGALCRYYLTIWSTKWFGTEFPYGTFVINLTGAFMMGFFMTWLLKHTPVSPELRLLVAVGFLGSYTTFSTYALDTAKLLRTGNYGTTLFYWAGSAILGIVGLEAGTFLAKGLGDR
jgi:fluoride exporter